MKHKYIVAVSLCGTLALAVMRTLQLKLVIDSATGFAKPNVPLNAVIYILSAIIVTAILVCSMFFSKRQPSSPPNIRVSPALAAINFTMVLYNLWGVGSVLVKSNSVSSTPTLLFMILSLLAVVFHLMYGISALSKEIKVPKLLTLAPVLLAAWKLITIFINTIGVSLISDNVYECLYLCLILFFFLLQGKIISRVEIRRSARLILPVALVTFALGCITSLSPLFAVALGTKLHSTATVGNIIPALYALLFMLALYKKKD